jgi:hypothetical protein
VLQHLRSKVQKLQYKEKTDNISWLDFIQQSLKDTENAWLRQVDIERALDEIECEEEGDQGGICQDKAVKTQRHCEVLCKSRGQREFLASKNLEAKVAGHAGDSPSNDCCLWYGLREEDYVFTKEEPAKNLIQDKGSAGGFSKEGKLWMEPKHPQVDCARNCEVICKSKAQRDYLEQAKIAPKAESHRPRW